MKMLRITAFTAAVSLLAAPLPALAAPATPSVNPWSALAFLNGGQSAAAYCGATVVGAAGAAAMQGANPGCVLPIGDPVAAPPPQSTVPSPALPPPLPGAVGGVSATGVSPLFIALGVVAGIAAAYFLLQSIGGGGDDNNNSPA